MSLISLSAFVICVILGAFTFFRNTKEFLHRLFLITALLSSITALSYVLEPELLKCVDPFLIYQAPLSVYFAFLFTGRAVLAQRSTVFLLAFGLPLLSFVAVPLRLHPAYYFGVNVFWAGVLAVFIGIYTYRCFKDSACKKKSKGQLALLLTGTALTCGLSVAAFVAGTDVVKTPLREVELVIFTYFVAMAIWHYEPVPLKETRLQLMRCQRMEQIGRLSGGLAHDINNVLSAISASAETLNVTLKGNHAEDIQAIITACARGRELTRNVLSYSRKGEYRKMVIDFKALVGHVEKLLRRTLPPTTEIHLFLDDERIFVLGDPVFLEQAVLNVCMNGAQSHKDRKGTLVISVYREKDRACVEVTDTGCGMDRETLSQVYDPFFTTKDRSEGTGLGLSVTYSVICDHGGSIEMDSSIGEGTTVKIKLPIEKQDGIEAMLDEAGITSAKNKRTVLVIDDEAEVRSSFKRLLSTLGWTAMAVASGIDALRIFEKRPDAFTVILLDQIMPEMKGTEVLESMKKIDKRIESRVIMCSGYTDQDIPDNVRFLSKPFDVAELVAALEEIMSSRRTSAPPMK